MGWVLAQLLLAAPASLAADPRPATHIDAARACYFMLDFDCARRELAKAEAGRDGLDGDTRFALDRLAAEVALSEQRAADVQLHLRRLVQQQPDWAPPQGSWPTPWLQALEAARTAAPDRAPPEVSVTVPLSVTTGTDLTLTVAADDASGVARVTAHVLTASGEVLVIALATTDGKTWRGLVPGQHVSGEAVSLWIEATDRPGNAPARWGSAEAPKRVAVDAVPAVPDAVRDPLATETTPEADDGTPVYETWWFWTLIGAGVAAGTGTLIYFLAESGSPNPTTGLAVTFEWPEQPP